MTVCSIDKNIPMPSKMRTKILYPYSDMEIGDSFFTISKHGGQLASVANKRHAPKRFSVRRDGDGFRIWRTA